MQIRVMANLARIWREYQIVSLYSTSLVTIFPDYFVEIYKFLSSNMLTNYINTCDLHLFSWVQPYALLS